MTATITGVDAAHTGPVSGLTVAQCRAYGFTATPRLWERETERSRAHDPAHMARRPLALAALASIALPLKNGRREDDPLAVLIPDAIDARGRNGEFARGSVGVEVMLITGQILRDAGPGSFAARARATLRRWAIRHSAENAA